MKKLEHPSVIREILDKYDFSFSKKFGQNFLIDANIITKIVSACDINETTKVIEVGPGFGSLTQYLVDQATDLTCYEIDKELIKVHEDIFGQDDNCEFIYENFLDIDLNIYEEKEDIVFVSNLPYYITTPIIEKIASSNVQFKAVVIMMQKEVGERILASPNSKAFGPLTVFIQSNFEVSKVVDVSRNCFMPAPNVDSVVLKLVPKTEKIKDQKKFEKFTKTIFSQRRKKLSNNLKTYNLSEEKTKLIIDSGIDMAKRPEQLELEQIKKLFEIIED